MFLTLSSWASFALRLLSDFAGLCWKRQFQRLAFVPFSLVLAFVAVVAAVTC